jgi:hypothetical protein
MYRLDLTIVQIDDEIIHDKETCTYKERTVYYIA